MNYRSQLLEVSFSTFIAIGIGFAVCVGLFKVRPKISLIDERIEL